MDGFDVADTGSPAVAAVSGGGSGIGRAVALALVARGLRVAVFGRRPGPLEDTAALAPPGAILPIAADMADGPSAEAALVRVADTLGPVDVAVAAAAVYPRVHFVDQSAAGFSEVMRVNIDGVANLIRPALSDMLRRGRGRVVVVGTLADMTPIPDAVSYSVSKGALHTLVRGLAAEIDPVRYPDVLVNELLAPPTRTGMNDWGAAPEAVAAEVLALVDLPSGGPSGHSFRQGRKIYLNETWKGAVKRMLGLGRR